MTGDASSEIFDDNAREWLLDAPTSRNATFGHEVRALEATAALCAVLADRSDFGE